MLVFFKHLHIVNRHRFEVFKLCCKVGIPFRGLVHDLSKYSFEEMSESIKYYEKSNGKFSPLAACKKENGYSKAWLHHFGRNKHHFEYWYDYGASIKTPIIPFKYMLEMICDRIAASKIYYGKDYNNSTAYEYFINRKDYYNINPCLNNFLEEVFLKLKNDGEIVLNKKTLLKMYLKHTKKESSY